MPTSRRILGVGIAALDIINRVASYPAEDDEVRATGQRVARGGNAANTLAVLRQFGHGCDWAGCYGDDASADWVLEDLRARGINTSHAVCCPHSATPTSYVVLSDATASRTIVHHRQLRELEAEDFALIGLNGYDWVHFEGRHPVATAAMIERVRREHPRLPISIEIEKPRPGLDRLLQPIRLLVFSRAHAQSMMSSEESPWEFLAAQQQQSQARLCVAPWGAEGAFGLSHEGERLFAPPAPPRQLRDTLGAGDVFNAALIDALLHELPEDQAMIRANQVAGYKCGHLGLDSLIRAMDGAGLL